MDTFITVLQVLSCIILVGAVLLQPAAKGSSFMASSASNASMGSSGGTTFLFKITMVLAAFLMLTSLYLSRDAIVKSKSSVIEGNPLSVPVPPAPLPSAPLPSAPPAPPAPTK
jgi:preprotein translocase subunit SecG